VAIASFQLKDFSLVASAATSFPFTIIRPLVSQFPSTGEPLIKRLI
jgi:hypothetical protein